MGSEFILLAAGYHNIMARISTFQVMLSSFLLIHFYFAFTWFCLLFRLGNLVLAYSSFYFKERLGKLVAGGRVFFEF